MVNSWFQSHIVDGGRLPLFCFFAAMVLSFGFIRLSVRMIRAEVRWWPGNVKPGGLHIHHVVFGVVFMLVGGVTGLVVTDDFTVARAAAAALFGVGAALVLDEFALILHLRDVYWSETGRTSIDAVFVAVALTGLLLVGLRPVAFEEFAGTYADALPGPALAWGVGVTLLNLAFAVVALLKGKIWTGLLGLILWPLAYVGAVRLARPLSPWSKWRYRAGGRRGGRKLRRAVWRERRIRRPMIKAKIWFQELIAGRHDSVHKSRP